MPTWIGDAVMATPTLRALRNGFPEAQLLGVMRPVVRDLLNASKDIDEYLVFEKRPKADATNRLGLIQELRRKKLDAIVLLTNSLWTAGVAKLAGIKRIVGYDRDARGWLLSDRLKKWHGPQPTEIEYYLRLAQHIGCDINSRKMTLRVSDTDQLQAEELWRRVGFSTNYPTIVINNNAATEPSRLWPTEHVRDLASRLAVEQQFQVLLHCAPNERDTANRLAAEVNHPRVASMGVLELLPIGLSKAVLAQAAVVLTTDSGPRHIAAAFDRPVVTLFGPTSPTKTRTFNVVEYPLSMTMACRPCYAKKCPLHHHQCMRDLSVQTVFDTICRAVGGIQLPSRVAA